MAMSGVIGADTTRVGHVLGLAKAVANAPRRWSAATIILARVMCDPLDDEIDWPRTLDEIQQTVAELSPELIEQPASMKLARFDPEADEAPPESRVFDVA